MAELKRAKNGRVMFTRAMKKEYTILVPEMLPIHFEILKPIFVNAGYKIELLHKSTTDFAQIGVRYVHNDACYPLILVVGQMIDALQSGKYDVNKTAFLMVQSGGGCRESNYIYLIRKALEKAGYSDVPVISFSLSAIEYNPGFIFTIPMILKCVAGVLYADLIMLLSNQTRPYEINKGDTNALVDRWVEDIADQFDHMQGMSFSQMVKNFKKIPDSFAKIPVERTKKTKVGIVGEIYVKYADFANNGLQNFLEEHNCEVMIPGLLGFLMFKIDARIQDVLLFGGSKVKLRVATMLLNYFKKLEKAFTDCLKEFPMFTQLDSYEDTKPLVKDLIGTGNRMGEGWFLPAEMIDLVCHGYENIVCTQPFGCLPTHVCGKGMIPKIKKLYPQANIVPIDYDPCATKFNQENRIKLMLSVAGT